ncbi:serine/threonine protein kinase [Amycolatopsis acidicola]|uniref:non-specific serine/threonine protein kinase n=1 Tax=Amycolatopsis acidicola TaxID=2596893 RepID=A0A5N0UXI6_9PSEU|nr:serine/threonine-protein kinase [Amycolatopsis acidicola]KAA9155799.1 serine/threonine protein kinase [Amycolatopsis acidicola]
MSIEAGRLTPLAEGPVAHVYAGAGVAVKVFPTGFGRDTAAALERERKALETVRAERAILFADEVLEFAGGGAGLRMELCRGSLAGLLASGKPLGVRETLAIGQTVAKALATGHRLGVVHGGVTPHNVLFRVSGELVLSDFGLALRRGFPRDPMYAVEYAAPEALRDDVLSPATDLYGLGAVLYAALTGAPPFPRQIGQQPGERILQVLREPVPPLQVPGVPLELSEMVGRLLAKDPADRPRDAASLADAFRKLYRTSDRRQIEFDDFARPGAPPVPPAPRQAPPSAPVSSSPGRTLVHSIGPGEPSTMEKKRFRWRPLALAVLGAAVIGLTVVPIVLNSGKQAQQQNAAPVVRSATPLPESTSASPPPDVGLVLDTPADLGDKVQLNWSAKGDLDFAVVVAGERIPTTTQVAGRQHSLTVPVDQARKYCFQIRATDGTHIYTTAPVAIRGGQCSL